MNKNFLFLSLGCAMLLTGCVKDEPEFNPIKLYAEGLTHDNSAKAAVIDTATYWVKGDKIWVNGRPCNVSVSGSGVASVSDMISNDAHLYRAVYPYDVVTRASGDNFTINVPQYYLYKKDASGRQILEGLPMVAYYKNESEDPEGLVFKHLTAAITVRVKNTTTHRIVLDRVEVANNRYQLSGEKSFDVKNANSPASLVTPALRSNEKPQDSVVMVGFKDNLDTLEVDGYLDVQVPILPVGDAESKFTIKVFSHLVGLSYPFSRSTVERDNHIGRACLGYAVAKMTDASSPAADLFPVAEVDPTTKRPLYEIGTVDEYQNLIDAMDNNWGNTVDTGYRFSNYKIVADLDFHGDTISPLHYYNDNSETACTFDGQGHTLENFVLSSVNENQKNRCGVFGQTDGDNITIKNLKVENAEYVFEHYAYNADDPTTKLVLSDQNACTAVGGIVGFACNNDITVEGCEVTNVKVKSQNAVSGKTDMYVGGVIGLVTNTITIRNCKVNTVDVNNDKDASKNLVDQFGGIVGRINTDPYSGTVSNYYDHEGNYTANKKFDVNRDPKDTVYLVDCEYRQGTPLIFHSNLKQIRYGGLIGTITEGGVIIINNCIVEHNVVFDTPSDACYAGGILGTQRSSNKSGFVLYDNCTVSGTITDNISISNSKPIRKINVYVGDQQASQNIYRVTNKADSYNCSDTCIVSLRLSENGTGTNHTTFTDPSQTMQTIANDRFTTP